jgi:hypothetical protein
MSEPASKSKRCNSSRCVSDSRIGSRAEVKAKTAPEKAETVLCLVLLCLDHTIELPPEYHPKRTAIYRHGYPNTLSTQKRNTQRGTLLMKTAVTPLSSRTQPWTLDSDWRLGAHRPP